MEYSIKQLSQIAGVTTRTLRHYDEIGLLTPARISTNGYRVYGTKEVDLLQQILFYREMDIPLDKIKKLLLAEMFDHQAALQDHLASLLAKREQIDRLIKTVEQSIAATKGETSMTDQEKFEGFKEKAIDENEKKYGEEIRANYGEDSVEASNRKFKSMTREQHESMERLSLALNDALKEAFLQGDPQSALAQKACAMHKEWLCYFWSNYTKAAHIGVTQLYVDDPRFTEYYDKIAVGCAEFLRDAVLVYCG